jgi:hypothetical protein
MKGRQENLYFENAWNDVMWRSKILDCILNPQAYLH